MRPHEHVFAPPPLRYTKAQARAQAASGTSGALDTISERSQAPKSPVYQRGDGAGSSSDVGDVDGQHEGPKKVQKGQIHALAKMLSALKANRGAH